MKATGKCFENCGRFIMDRPDSGLTLVHARVRGNSTSKIAGLVFSHAFIIDETGKYAIDLTKDAEHPVVVDLEFYKQLGRVHDEIE